MCTKSRDRAWTRLWRILTRYSDFTAGNGNQRSMYLVELRKINRAYKCSYSRCRTKCSTRATLHVQGHTRPVIEPSFRPLNRNSPNPIVRGSFMERTGTEEMWFVRVAFVIGTNLTGHPTNWKRPCTTSEGSGRKIWIIRLSPTMCRYDALCWIKLSRILHIWWCSSVNSFKFQSCDHTPPRT